MAKRKTFRLSDETEQKFLELVGLYQAKSENHALELMINELHELKKSKALVPYEELDKRDRELKMAFLKLGELQGVLGEKEKQIQDKDKQIQELEEQLKSILPPFVKTKIHFR